MVAWNTKQLRNEGDSEQPRQLELTRKTLAHPPAQTLVPEQRQIAVSLRDVWKIFGPREDDALKAMKHSDLSKSEVMRDFDCIVGIQGVSLDISVGETFCIMGLSGSGKSTLIRHINALVMPTAGEVLVNGRDVTKMSAKEIRALRADHISMVFQNFALLPHRSVLENVSLSLEIRGLCLADRKERATRALSQVGLSAWEHKFPAELSGGMQQRVGLARAMAGEPDIMLMDEPFSALDPLIRRQLQDEFIRLNAGTRRTTVFVTHDLDEAIRIGHRIAIMKDGALVQVATPEEILLRPVDAYVAEFTGNISRQKVISATSILEPVEAYLPSDLEGAPQVGKETVLDQLVGLAVESGKPVVIVDDDGKPIGVVGRSRMLEIMRGGTLT
jgi:glycine betaine/proline transport system ATP-binding protein